MLSKSSKVISAAVTVLALGTVGVTAAVASNSINMAGPVQTSSSVVSFSSVTDSSIMSASSTILSASSTESIDSKASSAPSQNGKVTKVADESSKAPESSPTSSSVAQPAQSSIQLKPGASIDRIKKNKESIRYPVIDPASGLIIWPNYSNYEAVKAELGGDAGTVDPDHSTACQKAKEEARQKYLASQAASSKVQKPAVPGQGDPNK